jgi:hypothetical protein
MAGLKINLDPGKAKELLSISSEVVISDFDRVVAHEVERLKLWEKFEAVIEKGLKPLLDHSTLPAGTNDQSPYRVTLHMPDTLQPEMLYQLIDYFPHGPFPATRGRRKSIRFGAIGKAWRLQLSDYSPTVPTNRSDLIKDWGMTAKEADLAGHGRQTFLSVILTDSSKIPLAVFYMDAIPPNFLGNRDSQAISDIILKECGISKLTGALVSMRSKMQDQTARPKVS